jgi:hypothetical protein
MAQINAHKGSAQASDKVRVTLDLPKPFHRRLVGLEELTHANRADVIRHALQIYEFVARKSLLEGYKFFSIDTNGDTERLAFFSPYAAELVGAAGKDEPEESAVAAR